MPITVTGTAQTKTLQRRILANRRISTDFGNFWQRCCWDSIL